MTHCHASLHGDAAVIMSALEQNWRCLEYANEELRNDLYFMHQAIQLQPKCLGYASESLRNHKDLVRTSLRVRPPPITSVFEHPPIPALGRS